MELLQSLLDASNWHLLSALLLGLMMSISPCPLLTNITAVGFISKNTTDARKVFIKGIVYTAGRAFSYSTLGIILWLGASEFQIETFFNTWGEKLLGPFLLMTGFLMLGLIPFQFPSFLNTRNWMNEEKAQGLWGAFFLGVIYALAFCPYSGIIFFGMLIPLTIGSSVGVFLPSIFGLGSAIPVIIFAWILAFAIRKVDHVFTKIKRIEVWFRKIIALTFMGIGIYYIILYYF